ncbi:MAG: beta-ketoacyl synthase chain length factor [Parafilimonas sp.]
MKIFIRSASCISAQQTFNHELFFSKPKEYNTNILNVIEPAYKDILEPKMLRRMSKIIRIGAATAMACLHEAGEKNVDAIITGTAYGCMEDSEKFLKSIVMQNEDALSPTAFIQSTHNTVGAQIALMLKCHAYNNTFVHRGFSFEHALLDAMLFLHENQQQQVLAGSADEITDLTFSVLKRFGLYKQQPVSNFDLYNSKTKGSIAGQGAAFFLLSNQSSKNDYAIINAAETFYNPADEVVVKNKIEQFLATQSIAMNDIDLIITGRNGDAKNDCAYDYLCTNIFKDAATINYKYLCGEYPTSTSFALWLAANIVKRNILPEFLKETIDVQKFGTILIYNSYEDKYHSLILVSSCNN